MGNTCDREPQGWTLRDLHEDAPCAGRWGIRARAAAAVVDDRPQRQRLPRALVTGAETCGPQSAPPHPAAKHERHAGIRCGPWPVDASTGARGATGTTIDAAAPGPAHDAECSHWGSAAVRCAVVAAGSDQGRQERRRGECQRRGFGDVRRGAARLPDRLRRTARRAAGRNGPGEFAQRRRLGRWQRGRGGVVQPGHPSRRSGPASRRHPLLDAREQERAVTAAARPGDGVVDAAAGPGLGCRRSVPHLQRVLGHLETSLKDLERAVGL
jgi:hypothetical protein